LGARADRADIRREMHVGVIADAANEGRAEEEAAVVAAALAAVAWGEDAEGGVGWSDTERRWWRWRWEKGARAGGTLRVDADAAKGARAARRPLEWRIRAAIGRLWQWSALLQTRCGWGTKRALTSDTGGVPQARRVTLQCCGCRWNWSGWVPSLRGSFGTLATKTH